MVERLQGNELEKMRQAGRAAGAVLHELGERLRPGISTREINERAKESIKRHGLRSSQYGYQGFKGHVCVSPNEVVCHGLPSGRVLQEGDIVNIDVTTERDGYHGDTSRMFFIGAPHAHARKLVETTLAAMLAGIAVVKDGARIGDIGAAIEEVAHVHQYSVVADYCGHGIGRKMHQEPQIPHVGVRGHGRRLRTGMVFTIEPMLNAGTSKTRVLSDGWTVVTSDGQNSAQFEHTIVVTESGAEILTRWP